VDANSSRLEILKKLITEEMVLDICNATNRYAMHVKARNPKALTKWKDVSVDEMWIFLAINLTMGILRKPSIKDYWSSEAVTASPFFSKTMSRNR